ncbi:MAG: phosphoenolpyruvate carboxykinase (ATP) [Phycisphaeraceae bacterium]|nr:phosphoenolpyruvate carboxykinase (ATP) [Phycisphaeraceae bacterium]
MPTGTLSALDLSATRTLTNASPAELIERAIRAGEGRLAANGTLVCMTGDRTGRSPKDKLLRGHPEIRQDLVGQRQPPHHPSR